MLVVVHHEHNITQYGWIHMGDCLVLGSWSGSMFMKESMCLAVFL